MRHLKAGRTLGRNASHRLALMRNLTRSLIEHGRIITTVEKAKELRPFIEKLITLAKKGLAGDTSKALHARRLVLARLGSAAKAPYFDENGEPAGDALQRLFKDIAPRFASRPGGYTRIIKRHERRLGDAGRTAFIELLKEGETKIRSKAPAPAPAPRVTEPTPPPAETPASPPAPAPEASAPPQTPPAGEQQPQA
jgi:large subunit ribosomal protein L17